jgi:hypothetical protein
MLNLHLSVSIFIARGVTDLCKSFDIEMIEEDPQSGHLFEFRNRVRILWWGRSGEASVTLPPKSGPRITSAFA